MNKRKILILSDWYLPAVNAGGPVRSVSAVAEQMKEQFDVFVLTTDRDLDSDKPFQNIQVNKWLDSNGVKIKYISPDRKKKSISRELKKEWDAIYLNSLFSFYFAIYPLLLNRLSSKPNIVIAPRGMLGDGALSLKKSKKQLFFIVARILGLFSKVTWQASSKIEKKQIESVFQNTRIRIIPNLSSINLPPFLSTSKESNTELKLVSIARIAEVKNLKFLIEVLAQIKVEYSLDIYGPIEEKEYWDECRRLIKEFKLNVNYRGELENHNVIKTVSNYHIYVLPTLGENFGHSILESLSASVPVLISDQTPWLKLSAQNAGVDLPLDSPNKWLIWLTKFHEMDNATYQKWRRGAWELAQGKLDQKKLVENYVKLFEG